MLELTKIASGTWTLADPRNYRGATLAGAGTLQVSGTITTTNFLIVSNTATLGLPGIVRANTVQINSGGTLTGCGAINGNLLNNGTALANCGATLAISGNLTNNGTMELISGSGLSISRIFVNNGLLDVLTGAQNLPRNLFNYRTVLLATNIVVTSFTKASGVFNLSIQGYGGHSFQLQRTTAVAPTS